jgi:hypothetical protein
LERRPDLLGAYPIASAGDGVCRDMALIGRPDTGYEKLIAQLAAGDVGDLIWLSTGVGTYFELAS